MTSPHNITNTPRTMGGIAVVDRIVQAAETRPAVRNPEFLSPAKYVLLVSQLVGLLLLVQRFNLESEAFFRLMALTVGGFAVHYFLPLRYRLGFFVVLSLTGIALVLGPVASAWLIGLGLAIIGLANLPVPVPVRALLLMGVGCVLALLRWGIGSVPWSGAIWPILGSMFVFRLIVYLYDRQHEKAAPTVWQTLGYFFLLPNVCFPLFPVVDFKKFCRNYYDDERHRIYQVGVEWIWRGLLQLVLYRLVYYHLTVDSVAVTNTGELLVFMLSTFLLYVRISGHFHLVIGMLHLFGFNLPETHHRYFLASSFTDFWRRINIYWKDFMLKVFYYPAYFRLRRLGDRQALILATVFTFAATWFLHLVQWFWIRGSLLVEWNDIIFWSLFGFLVLVNSLYETRRGHARANKRQRTAGDTLKLMLQTAGTFVVICTMWSFWTAESVTDWLLLMRAAATLPSWSPAAFAAAGGLIAVATALTFVAVWKGFGAVQQGAGPHVTPRAVLATTVTLCLLTVPVIGSRVDSSDVLASLQSASINRRDAEQFQRGYYENLLDIGRFNTELQQFYEKTPADFVRSLSVLGLSTPTGDEQDYELVPHREGRFVGAIVRTNSSGMRDRDYSLSRPPGTHRLALLGPSTTMGSGVEDAETFEARLEVRLNETAGTSGKRYEVLNFGVAGYTPLHILYQLNRKVFPFEPTMVLWVGHHNDTERAARQLSKLVQRGIYIPDEYLRDLVRRAGLHPAMGSNEARRRMRGYENELLSWIYQQVTARCRARNIEPVFMYLPTVTEPAEPWRREDRVRVLDAANRAGFAAVLDLTGVFDGRDASSLWIAEGDGHANGFGSRLVSDRLYQLLASKTPELGLPHP